MQQAGGKSHRADVTRRFATFFIDETQLGVDIARVQEINEEPAVTKVPLARDYVRGIMNLRGQIITIIDLRRKMGFTGTALREDKPGLVIVNWNGEQVGLLFDRIGEVIEAAATDIEGAPANICGTRGEFFQGVLTTGKQRIVALLDIDVVLADG
ncbi:MAG: chemotaxis protein CheW [Desulfobulbaceae bacterium]|jgi:purine-binding chemotaxis protein CheW